MLVPGVMTVGMGGIGAVLLVRSARERAGLGGTREGDAGNGRWQSIQAQCLQHAHELLRRKTCPIEVSYARGSDGPATVRVCLYDPGDPFCAVPVGSFGVSSTGGEGAALLHADERC